MKYAVALIPCLFVLSACASPKATGQRVVTYEDNRLQITSGTTRDARYVTVENLDKQWKGKLKGDRRKWAARKDLLTYLFRNEIEHVCGEFFYEETLKPRYHMMDKDETMGGVAPILGVAASMAAYAVAYSSTDEANIPVSVHTEFRCRKDNES